MIIYTSLSLHKERLVNIVRRKAHSFNKDAGEGHNLYVMFDLPVAVAHLHPVSESIYGK